MGGPEEQAPPSTYPRSVQADVDKAGGEATEAPAGVTACACSSETTAGNIEIDPSDECSICLSVLYRPVSPSACSHVFCMLCLYQSGLRSRCCPLCRAPFEDGVNIRNLQVVPGADEILAAKYREQYALQKSVRDVEWKNIQETIDKMTTDVMLFVMPSPGVEPNIHVQLHLFEPRYRYLAARALSSGAKIGWILEGGGEIGSRGRFCSIVHHRLNPDGTFDVVLHVEEMFQTETLSHIEIRQQNNQQYPPLAVADVTILPNP